MERAAASKLRIGAWCVDPAYGQISREADVVRVEERPMRVLLCLAARPGEVVSIDELLSSAWSGVIVTPDSVYQAVALLRRLLGDDARLPSYIVTVPRLGYRLVAAVGPWEHVASAMIAPAAVHAGKQPPQHHRKTTALLAACACAALCLVIVAALMGHHYATARSAATQNPSPYLRFSI